MTQNGGAQRRQEPDLINIKRNPYLVDYEEQRRLRASIAQGTPRRRAETMQGEQGTLRRRQETAYIQGSERRRAETVQGEQGTPRRRQETAYAQGSPRRRQEASGRFAYDSGDRRALQTVPVNRSESRRAAWQRRKRYIRRQRIAVGVFACSIIAVFCVLLLKPENAAAAGGNKNTISGVTPEQTPEQDPLQTETIQGLPLSDYTRHPQWTEDFLTPNEYSRPGEPLSEVKSIFVHYTANPGTSAAQNRSYFEQQKDMHQASVSAHFIIGYEGEILQCVPLDEIAYAVQSRNYDSVSVECCYKAEDGSFTQETYDSLISLLAWLTDVYDLETEDILRHYDCGGKKCPLYYTEHPDAWKKLKEDVEAYKQ